MSNPLFFLLFFSLSAYSQDVLWEGRDFLLQKNKVKTRTVKYQPFRKKPTGEWCRIADRIDFFDREGRLTKQEYKSPTPHLLVTNYFYYDSSGKLYASVRKAGLRGSTYSSPVAAENELPDVTTYYEYDTNQRLIRTYAKYPGGGGIFSESLISYDPPLRKTSMYTKDGYLYGEYSSLYERGTTAIKTTSKEFDSSGAVFSSVVHEYKNEFNAEGMLVESIADEDPPAFARYSYYKHGLLKQKKSDKFSTKWKIKYTYYK